MTKSKIIEYLGVIKSVYSYAYRDMSEAELELAADVWYRLLKDYDDKETDFAFKEAMKISKVPPVPADLIEQINKLQAAQGPSDGELWDECESVIYELQDKAFLAFHYGRNKAAEKEYSAVWEKASALVKEFLGTQSNALSINTDSLDYEKSRFFKALPQLKQRVKAQQAFDRQMLDGIDRKFIGEG